MVDGQLRDSERPCLQLERDKTESLREQEEEGNMIICSSDVASAFKWQVLDYT